MVPQNDLSSPLPNYISLCRNYTVFRTHNREYMIKHTHLRANIMYHINEISQSTSNECGVIK